MGSVRRGVLVSLVLAAAALWHPASAHLRAASLLSRFTHSGGEGGSDAIGDLGRHAIVETDVDLPGTRGRLYSPVDVKGGGGLPGLVVVHGVHWKGIDEPRLRRFARAIAESGVVVLTPEVRELCDYRIEPASIDTIGTAARVLSGRLGGRPVGVMGLSFAGGLSLIAASDARYAPSLAYVAAVGAHDDLGRVLRFFTSNEAARPDGTTLTLHAHDYGTVVLVYSHVEDFFPAEDVPVARDALRAWLHEDFDGARERAKGLSPEAAATMGHVFDHDQAAMRPEVEREIARLAASFAAVSPAAHLRDVRVPVFLLHGAGDTVIPSSETEWLAHDTPPGVLREALVSKAIEHVELEGGTGVGDQWKLVDFMSGLLDAAEETGAR
jgi:acetyl esterase/lipase